MTGPNKFFRPTAKFKYLETTVPKHNYTHEDKRSKITGMLPFISGSFT
jgi:hypothetical protein